MQGGDKLLTGCNDKYIRIFNLSDKLSEAEITMQAHDTPIKCAIWGKDQNHIVTCAEDTELR